MKKIFILFLFLLSVQVINANSGKQNDTLKEESLLWKLLYYGTLAPSTHNSQMWKIKILSENEFLILLDEENVLKLVDPDNREALISIGAFLGNVIRGAEVHGTEVEYFIYEEIQSDNAVARVFINNVNTGYYT